MPKSIACYLSVVVVLSGLMLWQSTVLNGLTTRYYGGAWGEGRGDRGPGGPLLRATESQITSERVALRAAQLFGDRPFSATFDGFISVDRTGEYEFLLETDGPATLMIDGEQVVQSQFALENVPGNVLLHAGLHAVHVSYINRGGDPTLDLRWRETAATEPARRIAAYRFFTSRTAFHLRWLLPLALAGLLLLAPGFWMLRHVALHLQAHAFETRTNYALVALLAGGTGMALAGLWWGLPNYRSWSMDEIAPVNVIMSLREGVAEGWLLRYPLIHFFVLSVVVLPFEIVGRFGTADGAAAYSYACAFFLMRAVSALMAVGTVYMTYLCAVELHRDRIAGLWSGMLVATMPVFVYYAKTANLDVPYLFWFVLSLLFYIRHVRHGRPGSIVAFAATGMLAICTKDQAYGFYVLPAIHILWLRFRISRERKILRDGPLALAVLTALAVLVVGQGVLAAPEFALNHFRLIVGPASQTYAVYDASIDGYLRMAADTVRQLAWMLSWPGLILCIAGCAAAVRRRAPIPLWLLLPAFSYYVCFIAVVHYQYDRFFLGVCVVLALFGGRLLSRIGACGPHKYVSFGACLLAIYLIAHGSAVNVAMILDSRYRVEDWIEEHVPHNAVVAMVGYAEDLPRAGNRTGTVRFEEEWSRIESLQPDYVVLNASIRCYPSGRHFYARIRGHSEYALAFGPGRSAFLFAGLAPEIYSDPCRSSFSNLSRINPPIEVYWRLSSPRAMGRS